MEQFLCNAQSFYDRSDTDPNPVMNRTNRSKTPWSWTDDRPLESRCSDTTVIHCNVPTRNDNIKLFVYVGDDKNLLEIDKIVASVEGVFIETDEDGYRGFVNGFADTKPSTRTYTISDKEQLIKTTIDNGYYKTDTTAVCLNFMKDVFRIHSCIITISFTNNTGHTFMPASEERKFWIYVSEYYPLLYEYSQSEKEILMAKYMKPTPVKSLLIREYICLKSQPFIMLVDLLIVYYIIMKYNIGEPNRPVVCPAYQITKVI